MSTSPLVLLVEDVCGPLYFAVILFTGIYGVTCMQTFYYYVHYRNDPRSMKIFVAVMWALDTIHEALTIAGVYKYLMGGLENPVSLLASLPEFVGLSGAMVALPTQAYLVYRIYVLSGKSLIAPLLWVIPAIYQIVAAILYTVNAFYIINGSIQVVPFTVINDNFFSGLTISGLVVSAVIDAAIAIAMIILLFRQRASTGFMSTLHVLQLLTIFAVNTGLWTAVFGVLSAILVHAYPNSLLYAVFAVPLSSLYCNALLANVNGRNFIWRQGMNMKDCAGAEMLIKNRQPCGGTTTEKESTRFSSAFLQVLDIRKTTETLSFSDAETTQPCAENMV